MTSVLTETRPIRVDSDLQAFLDNLLKGYEGEEAAAAKRAVVELLQRSDVQGTFAALCEQYREAAVAAVEELGAV